MQTFLLVLQVLVAVALIGLILLQQGKGADAGAAFGSGASTTVFGARGSTSFLTKATAALALIFCVNSFMLSYESTRSIQPKSVVERAASTPAPAKKPAQKTSAPASDLPTVPPAKKTQQKSGTQPAGGDLPTVPGSSK